MTLSPLHSRSVTQQVSIECTLHAGEVAGWFGISQDFGLQPQNLFESSIPLTLDQRAKTNDIGSFCRESSTCHGIFRSPDSAASFGQTVQHIPRLRLRHQSRRRNQ